MIGLLYVTEKQYSPETIPAAGTAPLGLTLAGLTPESSAFVFDATAPDPYAIPGALAGGDVDIGAQTIACPGSYTNLPSFGFRLAQPTPDLRVFFVARDPQADAALIVRMPDGTWYCNDNSFHTQQPTIDVIGSRATGGVSVWIGSTTPGESHSRHALPDARQRQPPRSDPACANNRKLTIIWTKCVYFPNF